MRWITLVLTPVSAHANCLPSPVLADQLVKRGERGGPGTYMVRQSGDVEIDAIEHSTLDPVSIGPGTGPWIEVAS